MVETIKGVAKCTFILFKKDDFTIAKFKPIDKENMPDVDFTMKGNMSVKVGKEYTIQATLDKKTNYKNSYDMDMIKGNYDLKNGSRKDLITFLETVTTKTRAENLVNTLPNLIDVLEAKDVDKLIEVKGIGHDSANKILNEYENQKDYSEAYIKLKKFDLTKGAIAKICKHFGSADMAIKKMNEDPYCIVEIDGFGFSSADSAFLANSKENKPTDNRRVEAYIDYMFEALEVEGNTWLEARQFIAKIKQYIPTADLKYAVNYVKESDKFVVEEIDDKKYRITSKEFYDMEMNIAKELHRLMSSECAMDLTGYENSIKLTENVNGWKYNDEQVKAIKGMVDNNVYMLQGLAGTGKAMPKWLEIPTPQGNRKLGELKVGDYVFDRLGRPTKILGVYPQGLKDSYEVVLSDGRKTWCNDEHLWTTYTSKGNFRTMTLREMLDMGLYHGTSGKKNSKFKIPVAKAVEYSSANLSVDPYVVGVFLGDGSTTSKTLTLCSDDEFVVDEVSKLIGAKRYERGSNDNYNWKFFLNEVVPKHNSPDRHLFYTSDLFPEGSEVVGLSHQKRIPKEYMYSSYEQRLAIVQGLMDTDGYILDDRRANVSYSSVSLSLVNDLKQLLGSLGYQSNLRTNIRDGARDCYELNINIPNSEKPKLFRLPRRKDIAIKYSGVKKQRDYGKVGIRDVVKLEDKQDMVCIMVDNDEHLFLANDFIVTHNTSTVKGFLNAVEASGYSYSQSALSGKASDNLTKATGKQGYTIHSLLGAGAGKGAYFKYNEKNKLESNVVVLDELSMVNSRIFLSLIKAIPSGSKLIMIGDFGQLEAIGVGVMGGLIRSKSIPMSLLKKVNRQSKDSAIITHSISIRNGIVPEELDIKAGSERYYGERQDLKYIMVDNSNEREIFHHTIKEFEKAVKDVSIEDIQIICSTKTTGSVSTYELNQEAQKLYNPYKDGDKKIELGFKGELYSLRVGDKVINMKNNSGTKSLDGEGRPIYNGNTGIITDITNDEKTGDTMLVIDFDGIGDVVVAGKDSIQNIQLGYAITCHKSQGSTIKHVILALPFHYLLNTREFLYTGMTRASDHLTLITSPKSFQRAIKNTSVRTKQIMLDEFIEKHFR